MTYGLILVFEECLSLMVGDDVNACAPQSCPARCRW